ncbi:hypothetical protein PoB_002276400 [Plakobranchus ocellatus]|uniref:Uncharacterized protein n=1 Tax=Plakobranchus ocellatus TaxID=259542 RepID=A0AAV3ZPF9_9GAST|nr:hypothetical protein PoB_002276400 [Plakobranchus ocellatus]
MLQSTPAAQNSISKPTRPPSGRMCENLEQEPLKSRRPVLFPSLDLDLDRTVNTMSRYCRPPARSKLGQGIPQGWHSAGNY